MAQQTAFQWFIDQLRGYGYYGEDFVFTGVITSELIEQAKQMEKEHIINACIHTASKLSDVGLSDITINGEIELAEQYYNETYGKE